MEQFFESRRPHFSLPLVWVSFSSFFEKLFWNDHCKLPVCNLWLTPHCLLKWLKLLKLVNNVIFIWVLLTSSLLLIWWKVKVLVTRSCPPLSDSMDSSLPGSSVHAADQARVLEWIAIFFSGDLPHSGITSRSPAIQAHPGLLQFRQILKHLSHNTFIVHNYLCHLFQPYSTEYLQFSEMPSCFSRQCLSTMLFPASFEFIPPNGHFFKIGFEHLLGSPLSYVARWSSALNKLTLSAPFAFLFDWT